VAATLRAFWNALIPDALRQDPDVFRQANRLAAFDLAMFIWVAVFTAVYAALGAYLCASAVWFGGVILVVILLALRRGGSPTVWGTVFCATGWFVYTALTLCTGGAGTPPEMWYASMPVLALFLSGPRWAIFWTLASISTITGFAVTREWGLDFPSELTPGGMRFIDFSGTIGLVACVHLLVWMLKNMEQSARQALHDANLRLEFQASTDGLTGIANRRSFDAALEREWEQHQRIGLPLSVVLIDADFFKEYNDVNGHLAGDDCLRRIARVIQNGTRRRGDLVARYGGEEFTLILPNTDENGAAEVAEQIRNQIKALEIVHAGSSVSPHVTISIGMATTVPTKDASPLEFLYDVDTALYRAKHNGRDQIVHIVRGNLSLDEFNCSETERIAVP
jgi:diguanylate cyclase (GGDEF)-like protein